MKTQSDILNRETSTEPPLSVRFNTTRGRVTVRQQLFQRKTSVVDRGHEEAVRTVRRENQKRYDVFNCNLTCRCSRPVGNTYVFGAYTRARTRTYSSRGLTGLTTRRRVWISNYSGPACPIRFFVFHLAQPDRITLSGNTNANTVTFTRHSTVVCKRIQMNRKQTRCLNVLE